MGSTKKILISQQRPSGVAAYEAIEKKYDVSIDFVPFFTIESLSSREFRTQRINLTDYTAVVFSSRHAIDAFFNLCNDLRVKTPETMKYFCTTEAIAMYLQKHIVYRKRKIFFGDGTPSSVVALIGSKHNGEKFLITTRYEALTRLFDEKKLNYSTGTFVKNVSCDLKGIRLSSYDLIVLYNPSDITSLYENFPDFKQEDIKFISFGKGIVKAMEEAGLTITVKAPAPGIPSAVSAIEAYLEPNK
mgnify:CR=1 FL=1